MKPTPSGQTDSTSTVSAAGASLSRLHEVMRGVIDSLRPAFEVVQAVKQNLPAIFGEIARALQALPDHWLRTLGTLAQHGWYVDAEMTLPGIASAAELFQHDDVTAGHSQMASYFDRRADGILRSLCSGFPHRATILEAAFRAHSAGEYELSVPILLSQADGICLERTGVQLYAKQCGGQATKVKRALAARFHIDAYTAALLHPLTDVFPITFDSTQRAELPDVLNRHAVLHGESVSYGTRINSCKAISLLSYTAWALSDVLDELRATPTA